MSEEELKSFLKLLAQIDLCQEEDRRFATFEVKGVPYYFKTFKYLSLKDRKLIGVHPLKSNTAEFVIDYTAHIIYITRASEFYHTLKNRKNRPPEYKIRDACTDCKELLQCVYAEKSSCLVLNDRVAEIYKLR